MLIIKIIILKNSLLGKKYNSVIEPESGNNLNLLTIQVALCRYLNWKFMLWYMLTIMLLINFENKKNSI